MSASSEKHVPIEILAPHFPSLRIDSFLAEGGMGAVYRAVQKELDRETALKLLSHEWTSDGKEQEMFRKEARLMAKLSHPNIVQIYDCGAVPELGLVFFLMEYVRGETLHSYIYRTRLSPDQAVTLMTEVANAIAYAHSEGVWHHDIKPGNVMLTPEGKVKVLDFGLAKLANETIANEGERFGTPDYAAPESYYEGVVPDHRSDIFSLGAILYELLTGAVPGEHYEPASKLAGSPIHLDQVITRSLARDPADRFLSAEDWAAALTGVPGPGNPQGRLAAVRSGISGSVQPGTQHPSVARRAPRKRIARPTLAKADAPRLAVAAPSVEAAAMYPPAPAKARSSGWVFPVVGLIGLLIGGIWFLAWMTQQASDAAADELARQEAAPESETVELQSGAQPQVASEPENQVPQEGSPPSRDAPPAPAPPPSSPLDLDLPVVARSDENGASLGGPLNQETALGINLATTSWTAVFKFKAISASAGKALVVMELGGEGAGLGLFLTEVGGRPHAVFTGAHANGADFGLSLPVTADGEIIAFLAHAPSPEGAVVSLRLEGDTPVAGQPVSRPTDVQAWIDGDLKNGFGGAAGRRVEEIGGARVFFAKPFALEPESYSFERFSAAIEYRLYEGVVEP